MMNRTVKLVRKTGEGVALKYYDTSEHGTRYLTRLVILYSGQQFCRASLKRALKLANAIYPLKIRRFRSSFATSKIFNQFRSLRNPFGSITRERIYQRAILSTIPLKASKEQEC